MAQEKHAKQAGPKGGAKSNNSKAVATPLRERVARAVDENRHLPRLTGRFTVITRGILSDRLDLCWAALEPKNGALKLWSYPPEEDCRNLAAPELNSFCQAPGSTLSCLIGHASTRPPTVPFKSLCLESLTNIDSNSHFRSIFISFKGTATCCLTAENEETFEEWMQALECYDAFVNPGAGGPMSPKSFPSSKMLPSESSKAELSKI